MIPDKEYEKIDRFVNSEMPEVEQTIFKAEIAQNEELAKVVALYQDLPNHLNNIQADLDFNKKLKFARNNYSQTSNKSTSWKWMIVGLIGIVTIGLVWKQFFATSSENSSIEEVKEKQQTLPEGVPIASLWEDSEMPPAYITRSGTTIETDVLTYQDAHQLYSQKNYTEALNILENISDESNIHGEVLLLKGVCQYELKQYNLAIDTYDTYIKLNVEPQDMVLWYQALACIQVKEANKAKSNLQKIIDNDYSKAAIAKELLKDL